MILHDAQKKIVEDTHRFRVVNAGRRFGKSLVAVEELLFAAVSKETNVAYIAPTYLQAREIAWAMLKKRVQEFKVADINETRLEMTIWNKENTTSKITLKGWESVESLRGLAFDFLVLDEVAMYRDFRSGWEEVVRPTLTDRKGKVLFISTPKGFNFWYDLYNLESTDTDFKSFHFTAYDNPFLSIEELNLIKTQLTEDRFSQEILADFRKTEGLVYPEFSREIHIFDEMPNEYERIAGVDFGYTHQAAVPNITIDLKKHYWVTEEWYKTGQTEDQIAEYVSNKRFQRVYPDPESPSAIEVMKRKGVNVREVIKNKDSVKSGINTIRELLKANRLHIHKKCVNLINEFETYAYPEEDKNQKELPIKEHDHLLDALRYAIATNEKGIGGPMVARQFIPGDTQQKQPMVAHQYTPRSY